MDTTGKDEASSSAPRTDEPCSRNQHKYGPRRGKGKSCRRSPNTLGSTGCPRKPCHCLGKSSCQGKAKASCLRIRSNPPRHSDMGTSCCQSRRCVGSPGSRCTDARFLDTTGKDEASSSAPRTDEPCSRNQHKYGPRRGKGKSCRRSP